MHSRRILLAALALFMPSLALSIQPCSASDHIGCIQANGGGWGCDQAGAPGDCCEGDCTGNCDTWTCKVIAISGPGGGTVPIKQLKKAFHDFVGAIGGGGGGGTIGGGGTGSGMGVLVPSYVADLAWVRLVQEFRTYAVSDAGRKDRGIKTIRVGEIDISEPKPSKRLISSDEHTTRTCHQSKATGTSKKDPREEGPAEMIEFMRPTSDPTVLSAVVAMYVAENCTLIREDYYAYGAYGWSSNRNGDRLRPPTQEKWTGV